MLWQQTALGVFLGLMGWYIVSGLLTLAVVLLLRRSTLIACMVAAIQAKDGKLEAFLREQRRQARDKKAA